MKNPKRVINNLDKYYQQKAWFQITDSAKRTEVRDKILYMLFKSLQRTGNEKKYKQLVDEIEIYRKHEIFK
ncbi:MAG: hypothetical protein IH595_07390 [Bacteroidales bacterium]|nr:hypothetical protein [Bacteroidales bacterium]